MAKKRIAKATAGRPVKSGAVDSAGGPPDFNSKDYMTNKDGFERFPDTAKKVKQKGVNKAASPGADLTQGGNNV